MYAAFTAPITVLIALVCIATLIVLLGEAPPACGDAMIYWTKTRLPQRWKKWCISPNLQFKERMMTMKMVCTLWKAIYSERI